MLVSRFPLPALISSSGGISRLPVKPCLSLKDLWLSTASDK